ncbi:MAG: hypothetical protein ACXVSX_15200 [Solirubrobacteraceae bacterium]
MTRMVVVGATGLSGLFSVVAAQAFKGHARKGAAPRPTTRVAPASAVASVPGPQNVPSIGGEHRSLRRARHTPTAAQDPSAQSAPAQSAPAPAQQPAPAPAQPAPAPAPPPPPPVVSGGS